MRARLIGGPCDGQEHALERGPLPRLLAMPPIVIGDGTPILEPPDPVEYHRPPLSPRPDFDDAGEMVIDYHYRADA